MGFMAQISNSWTETNIFFTLLKIQGQEFGFNVALLIQISPFFEKILENNDSSEKDNCIDLDDTTPETLDVFKKLMVQEVIKKEDVNFEDLFRFSKKFDFQRFFDLCSDQFGSSLNKKSLLYTIKLANELRDDNLLRKAAIFWDGKRNKFKKNVKLKEYLKHNQDCASRMLQFIMFK